MVTLGFEPVDLTTDAFVPDDLLADDLLADDLLADDLLAEDLLADDEAPGRASQWSPTFSWVCRSLA